MNKLLFVFILSNTFYFPSASAQLWNKVSNAFGNKPEGIAIDEVANANIKNDINYLCSNAVLGRKSGTKGEEFAGVYLEKRMNALGLTPYINNSYRQHFKFESDKRLSKDCKMTIGSNYVFIPEQAVPMAFSNIEKPEDNFFMPKSEEPNSPWVVPLYKSAREANDPAFDWEQAAYEIALKAQKKGASSVVLYDEYGARNLPSYKLSSPFDPLNISVVIVQKNAYDKYIKDIKTITPISINIAFSAEVLIGTNIVGYYNNNAEKTIIIGAHYDHLGEAKLSGRIGAYFQGADNNASGVAVMLAIASKIQSTGLKDFNYVFVAFSAHENGLRGSKAFLNNLKIDKKQIACMIDMDRVGLLKNNKKFYIEGMGSALAWNETIQELTLPKNMGLWQRNKININSEHIDFYTSEIPSILITTGKNNTHGTLNDVPNNLNYDCITNIANYTLQMLEKINENKVTFRYRKIRNQDNDLIETAQ